MNILKTLPLVFVLLLAPLVRVAKAQQLATGPQSEQVKADVDKRLASKKEKVVVQLQNGSQIKGRIAQAGNNSFTVTDAKSGQRTEIVYADVTKLKGQGLGKWTKVAIFTGIGVGAVIIIAAIAITHIDIFDSNTPIFR